MTRSTAGVLLCLVACATLLALAGCRSGGPQVSGFGIGDLRIVSVGEILEVRIPLADDGSRQWRVSSFDSLYLSLIQRPRVEVQTNGSIQLVTRARAKTVGETVLELTSTRPGDARTIRFDIRIIE